MTRLGRQILISGGAALGRAIAILLNLLSPALVVIGGHAAASQLYTEQARQTASVESLAQPFRSARIITSDIELTSGAQGAATLMLNELFTLVPPRDGGETNRESINGKCGERS